jgi:ABC-2 type transport system ATP-binding protein
MKPVIEVRALGKRFGEFRAVKGISFEVAPGEIFGYLGANGAGKSTTIRILCGLMAPSEGRAMVADHDVALDPEGVRMSVGYMSQKFSLYPDLTALENMDFFGGAYRLPRKPRLERARRLLADVDLSTAADTLVRDLPGGIRQRLALATALLHEPRIVFLDEPTAGVDPEARRNFWRIIRRLAQGGTTVFVTTHYMDEAEYCGRVGLMVDGRLVALDTPAALKRDWVKSCLFAVRGARLRADVIAAIGGVSEVVPFGAGLHVHAERDVTHEIERALGAVGAVDVSVEPIAPTLEDVFLAVAGRGGA